MGDTEALVFLHGFTQTHHHWHRCASLIAKATTPQRSMSFVDMPGHGLSSDERCSMPESTSRLNALCGAGTWIGYSMGARFALAAAACEGSPITRLVLVGGSPGIADDGERLVRQAADRALAERMEDLGVEQFVEQWLSAPMFATLPDDPAGRRQRLSNTAQGLASSMRIAGTGSQAPVWADLHRISIPVLVLAGRLDDKYCEIGRQMVELLPNAQFRAIDGAGHAAHIERPEATAAAIGDWLAR